MGASGRERAQQVYDWKVIIAQYEALWAEQDRVRLAAMQDAAKVPAKLEQPWPARMDPFHAFSSYPTQALKPSTILALVDNSLEAATARLQTYQAMAMVNFAKFVLPSDAEITAVLKQAAAGPQAAIELVQTIDNARKPFVFRTLVWLLKMGILKMHA
jgi:hypothetical protein